MDLLTCYKEICDSIHGHIKLTKLACLIIDTPQFQRLRYLHQLGTCHYTFPNATHTRFEHSIGTYHLAGKVLDTIKSNSNQELITKYLSKIPELKKYFNEKAKQIILDPYVCELVKIAALCHDIGHGIFSHVFDDVFIKIVTLNKNGEKYDNKLNYETHENRSIMIIKYIIKNNDILNNFISDDEIQFISNLINPTKSSTGFIYQIVSNSVNSIDVDKFDYICRDTIQLGLKYSIDIYRLIDDMKLIDNKICFPEKIHYEIISLFKTRYRLHKQIYNHKSVISIQYMMNDIMLLLDDIIGIYDSIFDVERFTDLTDDYLITFVKILYKDRGKYDDEKRLRIDQAYNLLQRIYSRNLYKLISSSVSKVLINLDLMLSNMDKTKMFCCVSKIGFVSGSKDNPLNKTYFYKKNDPNTRIKVSNEHISFLVPKIYQEYIYMFFLKNNDANNDNNDNTKIEELKKQLSII